MRLIAIAFLSGLALAACGKAGGAREDRAHSGAAAGGNDSADGGFSAAPDANGPGSNSPDSNSPDSNSQDAARGGPPDNQFQGAPAPGPRTALPPGAVMMERVALMDPSGFEKPLVAAHLLAPAGWRLEGGIAWGPLGLCGPDYAGNFALRAPDGVAGLVVRPASNWEGVKSPYSNGQSNCETAFYGSAQEYLSAYATKTFPNARILDYRPLTDEAKPLNDMIAQMGPMPLVQGMEASMQYDAGEVLVAFEDSGRDMRASIHAVVLISRTRLQDLVNPGQIALDSIAGYPTAVTISAAPAGQLDLGLRKRVMSSVRYGSEWMARVAEYQARKSRAAMKASSDAHDARMAAIKKQGEIANGVYEDRQIASDRNQREFIEYVRGVETYDDPVSGSPVQLDNTYEAAFRVQGSEAYILTNDTNFNPGQYGLDAVRLERTQ